MPARLGHTSRPRRLRRLPAGAVLAAALLAGCADRHSVDVGAVPDDYRTRHPIVVSEAETAIELPVVSSEHRLPESARARVEEFAGRFKTAGASVIRVMLPSGSLNEAAAGIASKEVVTILRRQGIAHDRILLQPYEAGGLSGPAPIRLSFNALAARTAPCGRWPEDLGDTSENKNYFNFGCASQQNLAAQIVDPRDLLGPRASTGIDAERRTNMLDKYRTGAATASAKPPTDLDYDW
ncbi:CpaD family pilus assembly protein [Aurantimonas sp. MSK8Z-1]|uniref:CpaD family pilus assembly protein n=1 Tax=Mangrovibrevibacter kandeliae TaxID=2968473 RepID=UPI002118AF7E|nr:CpaD family pilus assembly lipoprotein [Aurantimonas sp. MSK8Z-1]MCW4115969.1 CpaD family pilus assembly protein [Aurantimonas sp. MSK8Z-1]